MGKYLQPLFFAYFYPLNGSFLFATEDDIASLNLPENRKGTRKGTTENRKLKTDYVQDIHIVYFINDKPPHSTAGTAINRTATGG